MGQTYDHTILDIEYSKRNYLPGDVIDFEIDYTGLLAACTMDNITKKLCMIEAVNYPGKVRKGLGIDV